MRALTFIGMKLGLIWLLTGCASNEGFSTGGLPPRLPLALYHVYIETTERDSALNQAMRQEFMAQGVRVADMPSETKSVLRITREGIERRAGSGTSSERQIIYTATYVATVDGRELFFPETLNTYRNYNASSGGGGQNPGGMGLSFEEASIVDNLARDMARQIMRKLTSLRQE